MKKKIGQSGYLKKKFKNKTDNIQNNSSGDVQTNKHHIFNHITTPCMVSPTMELNHLSSVYRRTPPLPVMVGGEINGTYLFEFGSNGIRTCLLGSLNLIYLVFCQNPRFCENKKPCNQNLHLNFNVMI